MDPSDVTSEYWPISVSATILAWLGYLPEFCRLWRERSTSQVGVWMWVVWIASSGLSTAYACAVHAAPLVVLNLATVCFLIFVTAAGNFWVGAYCSCAAPRTQQSTSQASI